MPEAPNPEGARHRTLWISDVHLGSSGSKAARLAQFLKDNECEQLYLVGDIFDGWKIKKDFYWTPDHSLVLRRLMTKARRGTIVNYLPGNHDAFLRQFVQTRLRVGRVRLMREAVHTTADGRRILVTHGDRFDSIVNRYPRMALAADFGYEKLIGVSERINSVRRRLGLHQDSFSARVKDGVKAAVQYLSQFDRSVVDECHARGCQGVLCGHTHHAEIRDVGEGITSYNCGDWVESCTALSEDFNGVIRIIEYDRRTPPNVRPLRSATQARLGRVPPPDVIERETA